MYRAIGSFNLSGIYGIVFLSQEDGESPQAGSIHFLPCMELTADRQLALVSYVSLHLFSVHVYVGACLKAQTSKEWVIKRSLCSYLGVNQGIVSLL